MNSNSNQPSPIDNSQNAEPGKNKKQTNPKTQWTPLIYIRGAYHRSAGRLQIDGWIWCSCTVQESGKKLSCLGTSPHALCWCFSCRMRDRAPCICGVGVWSLLLSLCLASLTHAHRSHTGRCLYMFPPAGRVALASRFTRRGLAASNFYSRVVDLEWIGCAPPEGTQTSHSKGKQRPQGLVAKNSWKVL